MKDGGRSAKVIKQPTEGMGGRGGGKCDGMEGKNRDRGGGHRGIGGSKVTGRGQVGHGRGQGEGKKVTFSNLLVKRRRKHKRWVVVGEGQEGKRSKLGG